MITLPLLLPLLLALLVATAVSAYPYYYEVCVKIESDAPNNGVWFSNFWLGIHDGDFDVYDTNEDASEQLERLAEDGDTSELSDLFDAGNGGNIDDKTTSGGNISPGDDRKVCFEIDYDDFDQDLYFSFASQVLPSVRSESVCVCFRGRYLLLLLSIFIGLSITAGFLKLVASQISNNSRAEKTERCIYW